MNLIKAAMTAIQHPGMPKSYCRYSLHEKLGLGGPYIRVGDGSRIGHTRNNFSEYWSYQGGGQDPDPSLSSTIASLVSSTSKQATGNAVAIDVGANIGMFTVAFADAGFSEVHAFEPVHATFVRLAENVALNHFGTSVHLNQVGLGDRECVVNFRYDAKSPATAHITAEVVPGTYPIQITTLDQYARLNGIQQVNFLKIDTEGYETAVFRGAVSLLRGRRLSVVLLEWCPELLVRAGSSPDELWHTIRNAGYVVFSPTLNPNTKKSLTLEELKSRPWANLMAIPAETAM